MNKSKNTPAPRQGDMSNERLSDDDLWRLLIGHTVVPFAFSNVSRQWMDWAKRFVLNTAFIPAGHRPDKRTGLDRDTGLALYLCRIMHVMDSLYDGQMPGGHHMPMSHNEPLLRDALSLAACYTGLTVDFSRALNVAMREQWIQGYKFGGFWGTAPIDYTLTNTGMYRARSNAAPPFHDAAKPPFFATEQEYSDATTVDAPQVPVNQPAPTAPPASEQSELPLEGNDPPIVYSVPKPAPMPSGNRQTPTTEKSAGPRQPTKAVTPAAHVGAGTLPSAGQAKPGDETEVTWQDIQARLLRLRDAGERYTSYGELAGRLGCSKGTIHKAVNGSPALKGWVARAKASPSAQRMNDVVADNTPCTREGDPADYLPDDDVDREFNRLLQEATPEGRAQLNAYSPKQRREIARMSISQRNDDTDTILGCNP